MKIKSNGKKSLKHQITFQVDLSAFAELTKKKVKWLSRTSEVEHPNLIIRRDANMN